jgi:PIN domain nuclease of toxin-antitoxin system
VLPSWVDFDHDPAERAGHLRPLTRNLGLSLGVRACLATAQSLGCTVLTADRAWAELDLGIRIEAIR